MSATPRRIVTGHDASGRSVVLSDAPTPKTLDVGSAAFHEVWITDRTPSPIAAGEPEPTDRPLRTPPPAGGVLVRFTEMRPGAESPMHRTETVDVGVVLEGETWLLLDDGPRPASASVTRSSSAARTTPGRTGPTTPSGWCS
jgi:quercetin dioxygenase-like cupin family protein